MNIFKFLLFIVPVNIFFIGCQSNKDSISTHSDLKQKSHYVSIDGLWKCTSETSLKFPNGILEPVIKISGELSQKLTIQGFFLWDDHFYDDWPLVDIQFHDSINQLTFKDGDGSLYVGMLDRELQTISGIVYSGNSNNEVPEDKLDFIRADTILATRLFIPRLPDLNGSITYSYCQPKKVKDGLQTASIFEFISDSTTFYDLMVRTIRQEYGRLESLLIIKEGKLVLEEYYYGYNERQLHNIHSCTKSIISLLLGMVLESHNVMDVEIPIFNFFPYYDSLKTEGKEKITLKHVLTMTAGFQEEEGFEESEYNDYLQYILSLPLESKPGEKFKYSNDCSNLLGGIIYSLEGRQVDEFAEKNLFSRMGILNYYWETENGIIQCHSGLHMLPRDMSKIGLLVLNDGKWRDEPIIPKKWIEESTKPHVSESKFYNYGFQWWHRSKENVVWWKNLEYKIEDEHNMIIAFGFGGQYIMIIRDLDMVIVTTASDYGNGRMARSKVPMVIEEIVPLFWDSGL